VIDLIRNKNLDGDVLLRILSRIHEEGPIRPRDFENLAHFKKFQPEEFEKIEPKLMSLMGLFYKTQEPNNAIELVYSIFAESIKETTGYAFTPVQADAFNRILDKTYFSFSAPTSAGKSHLFRELISSISGDIIIVVPSRALISEYISLLHKIVDNSVLVLDFIELVNLNHTVSKIYVITPERGVELFKNLDRLNVELFLFDEAQLSEDGIRGMKFDSFVRRADKALPTSKKVFTHPFIENPEGQLKKHSFLENGDFKSYVQNTVGKIYVSRRDEKFYYFSPFDKDRPEYLAEDELLTNILNNEGSILIYTSKSKIYDGSFIVEFEGLISQCPILDHPDAKNYVEKLRKFFGASDRTGDKQSTLVDLMSKGIVIHHGSIPLKARLLIEEFVNAGHSKICFSTSTLTQGINMPFDAVWVTHFRFTGDDQRKILDLKNLIGRAGRSSKEINSFNYGYVIIEQRNIDLFCSRINANSTITESSQIDSEVEEVDIDLKDVVEAIRTESFNDDLHLTNSQVERISTSDIEASIKHILDTLLPNGVPITGRDYYALTNYRRKKVKNALADIYTAHLRRRTLTAGEKGVLSAAIPMLLWQIQGKSFAEIVSLRHAFISEKDKRTEYLRSYRKGEITRSEYQKLMLNLPVRFSAMAEALPNKRYSRSIPLYQGSVINVDFDRIIYDTYDFIDKVISLSLRDPLNAAFQKYFDNTNDFRGLIMINYIKYGTNNPVEIWLIRYGFSFVDIEWLVDYIDDINENEITFKPSIHQLDTEKLQLVERYLR